MDGESYRALRARCYAEFDDWSHVAEAVEARVASSLRRDGLQAEVSARAKDPDSLLRKMVFTYKSDDLNLAGDRAGARIVVHLPSDVERVCELVRQEFAVVSEENKADSYEAEQFSYRGIHLDCEIAASDVEVSEPLGKIMCEIQVRTVAEHAWSVLSHLLTYKAPGGDAVPKALRRRINRLIAMEELFDVEATAIHQLITERPEYRVQRLVFDLERVHARALGDELSHLPRCDPDIVGQLVEMFGPDDDPSLLVTTFASDHSARLRQCVRNYGSDVTPLVHTPEALVIWERLESDAVAATTLWPKTGFPSRYLEDLATIWGIDLPDLV